MNDEQLVRDRLGDLRDVAAPTYEVWSSITDRAGSPELDDTRPGLHRRRWFVAAAAVVVLAGGAVVASHRGGPSPKSLRTTGAGTTAGPTVTTSTVPTTAVPIANADRPPQTAAERAAAVAHVTSQLQMPGPNVDWYWWSTRLIDQLPNVSLATGHGVPVNDTVVVGDVVATGTGVGWVMPADPADEVGPNDGQTMVPFATKSADWRTVHAIVKVTSDLGDTHREGDFVTVGFSIGPDVDADLFLDGLRNLGPAVFFADSKNPIFINEPTVAGVDVNGALVATISADGRLALPFITEPLANESSLADSPTLAALTQAARQPDRILHRPR